MINIIESIKKLFRTITLADFWKRMMDLKDATVSSTTFIYVFGGVWILFSTTALIFYSASMNQGLPGGSVELVIGLATIILLGKTYTSYTLMKKGDMTTSEQTDTNKDVTQ